MAAAEPSMNSNPRDQLLTQTDGAASAKSRAMENANHIAARSEADAAFREAANKRAAMEARLSEEQRARYQALWQKQDAELKRQEQRLNQRRQEYQSEVRKNGIVPSLDMIPLDRNTPRALRDAAREYASQDQWVADLKKVQEREQDKFLERAQAGEPAHIEPEGPRARPLHE